MAASVWQCLCIFDPTRSQGKEDRALDNVLYFWPEAASDNEQMNYVGLCVAVAGLADRFGASGPESLVTDAGVTVLANPAPNLWLAGTVPLAVVEGLASAPAAGSGDMPSPKARLLSAGGGPNVGAAEALLGTLLLQSARAFVFRYGAGGLDSPSTLRHYYDRFCAVAAPYPHLLGTGGAASSSSAFATARERRSRSRA